MSAAGDNLAVWRAQLADMPLGTIIAWLREQGWVLRPAATHGASETGAGVVTTTSAHGDWVSHGKHAFPVTDGLPLADADLPFDASKDGRG